MSETKKRPVRETFNPVKEDKDGILAKRAIWSTNALNLAIDGIKQGRKLMANPFYDNNTNLLKGDLVYNRTEEEIQEWFKCKNDILYFVEKYCKLMTPEGIKNITLRDYQKKYLRHLEENRLSIYLSARQAGKCLDFLQLIDIKIDTKNIMFIGDKLKKYLDKKYYIIEGDYYKLPLFELYNIFDNSFKWKILYQLYKFLYSYETKNNKIKTR